MKIKRRKYSLESYIYKILLQREGETLGVSFSENFWRKTVNIFQEMAFRWGEIPGSLQRGGAGSGGR